MEETKLKAIILKSTDYKEADKICTAFSLEFGKISVKFNGVKRDKAKLKVFIQPFMLEELECIRRGDFFTVKTGVVLDSYPKILNSYTKTICAYIALDILNQILIKNKAEPQIFLQTIKTLNDMEEKNEYRVLIEFILAFMDLLGEKLNCNSINQNEVTDRVYLDYFTGNFSPIRTADCIEIDKKCYQNLSTDLGNDKLNIMTLKMLNNILRARYSCDLNSFSFL